MNEPVLARLQHLMTLREEVETLTGTGPWNPSADWADADSHLILYVDVPGVNPDTLELLEEEGSVTIAGQRDETHRLLRGERPAGLFRRTLTFPEDVLPQTGQASLAGGVLCVRFEKRHPTINVQSTDAPADHD